MNPSGSSSVHRDAVRTARSVVVKIGTTALTTRGGRFDANRLRSLVDAIEARMTRGSDVVIVSSGAIAAGIEPLGLARRPTDLATKQAAASVGQVALVNAWSAAFGHYGRTVGQVLLTAHDISMRLQHTNAQRTLDRLRALHAVAIVNENDTVATNEIRFGDNDRLAALVAHLVQADALILLSDVDALYTAHPSDPDARRIDIVEDVEGLEADTSRAGSSVGTGGMATKIEAARIATDSGVPVLLASADAVADALAGRDVGTLFLPTGRRRSRRLLWLAYASKARGELVLDEGAVAAVAHRQASLLPAGITGVKGDFHAGDPVKLVDAAGRVVARGIVNYDASDLPSMLGRSTRDLVAERGAEFDREVVHRDQLTLKKRG